MVYFYDVYVARICIRSEDEVIVVISELVPKIHEIALLQY